MKTKHDQILFMVFFFLSTIVSAQEYRGQVIGDNNEGIGFAHVFFQNDQTRGSTTNEIGKFVIYVTEVNKADTLVISVLGYKTKFIPYAEIDSSDNIIKLNSSALLLGEITIISDSYFKSIIKEAIAKIPENYPVEKHLQKAYYQNYTISDTSYSEMIEADFQLISNGYQHDKLKEEVYLNQLRRTEDNRNLPARLRHNRNGIINTLFKNRVYHRSLSKWGFKKDLNTIDEFISSVDDISSLLFHNQSIQDGDTILTIKVSDPLFKINNSSPLYTLLSINLRDKAIVKMVFGDPWSEKKDFEEVVYRKIHDRYYPAYMRRVSDFEFDKETKKHYTSHCILFYDLVTGKHNIKACKKGKKMKIERGLRQIKMNLDNSFWENYPYSNQLSATSILRSKLNRYK